jgi:hypothetical protein
MFENGYEGMSDEQLRENLREEWTVPKDELEAVDILWASGNLGDYEEWSWFLIRNKETGELFEVSGSHCSCYGFEDQWKPAPTTVKYLLSNHFYGSSVSKEKFQEWAAKALADHPSS